MRKRIGLILIMLLPLCIICVFCGAVASASDGKPYKVNASGDLILLASDGEINIMVSGNSAVVFSESSSYSFDIADYCITAAVRGASLYVLSPDSGVCKLSEYDIDSGELSGEYLLSVDPGSVSSVDIDFMGRCYIMKNYDSNLYVFSNTNTDGSVMCEGVSFFSVIDDELAVFDSSLSFYSISGTEAEFIFDIETDHIPAIISTQGLYIDTNGVLCKYNTEVTPLLNTSIIADTYKNRVCFLNNRYIYYVDNSGRVILADAEKTEDGIKYFAKNEVAVNENGILTKADGRYEFINYSSFVVNDEKEEGNTGDGLPDDWKTRGNYIIFTEQRTVSSIKSEYDCTISDSGENVDSGFISTGMSLSSDDGEYVVVLLGDVNSSGTVNSADRALILKNIVGIIDFDEAKEIAADIDEDGIVGISDSLRIKELYIKS